MGGLATFFKREEKDVLHLVEEFNRSLTLLRYEGKKSRVENIKIARKSVSLLAKSMRRHRKLQEKVIFSFLMDRVPRKEAVIHFLRSDHQTIKSYKAEINELLGKVLKGKYGAVAAGKIQERGIYLVSLLRHHIELEKESIEKTIKKELDRAEKQDLEQKVNSWLKQQKK